MNEIAAGIMNSDDFIAKFFGRYGRIDPGFVPNAGNSSSQNEVFTNDVHEMFQNMEDMIKTFSFGNFEIIESNSIILYFQLNVVLESFIKI